MDRAGDMVFWAGKDGQLFYANETACRCLGYSYQELRSMSVPDIEPGVTEKVWTRTWEETKQRTTIMFESSFQKKDGTRFPVEITAHYLEYNGNAYACGIVRDMTDRTRSQYILQDAKDNLERLVQERTQVLHNTNITLLAEIQERKRAEEALKASEQQLRQLLEDRERISQNLHDGILQSIYSVGLELETARMMLSRPLNGPLDLPTEQMDQALARLKLVTQEVRSFLTGLKYDTLQGRNLESALLELLRDFGSSRSLPIYSNFDPEASVLIHKDQGPHLLNIARKGLSNSLRHARPLIFGSLSGK